MRTTPLTSQQTSATNPACALRGRSRQRSGGAIGRIVTTPIKKYPATQRSRVVDLRQAREQNARRISPLDRYLEGWAKGNLEEILAAVAPDYCFRDPLIGTFSRRSLHEYFDTLMNRLGRIGPIKPGDMAFELRGPMAELSRGPGIWFWREASWIGLTGVTQIEVGEQGVLVECVAYDSNMASHMLRCAA